jgi:hypothetical protein
VSLFGCRVETPLADGRYCIFIQTQAERPPDMDVARLPIVADHQGEENRALQFRLPRLVGVSRLLFLNELGS